ncbi:unnamed protein product [Arabidopsis lyrata]|uniref:Predicted protein n=1 Tax=Arabidopsis lyrata subsp. lyrata TaxID=81972 RepID=D7KQQ3_ARALL|nr:predicted protein [Arabidopsis lyrata subsp. lyrata]CAH8253518.1 unnamed protein product [Arabidopsis lyrata]
MFLSLFSLFYFSERKKLFRSNFAGGCSPVNFVSFDRRVSRLAAPARSAVWAGFASGVDGFVSIFVRLCFRHLWSACFRHGAACIAAVVGFFVIPTA